MEGTRAHGEYFVPMATTEAALVASYARGMKALTESGGCRTVLVGEMVPRHSPATTPQPHPQCPSKSCVTLATR